MRYPWMINSIFKYCNLGPLGSLITVGFSLLISVGLNMSPQLPLLYLQA